MDNNPIDVILAIQNHRYFINAWIIIGYNTCYAILQRLY